MQEPLPYDLHAALGYQLSLTARTNERPFEDALKAFGLTRITWCILITVQNENLSMPSAIAKFIGIDRTATSRALKSLEKSELIARFGGQDDKRTTSVKLTAKGLTVLAKVVPVAQLHRAKFTEKLTDAEHKQLLSLLSKLRAGEDAALTNI